MNIDQVQVKGLFGRFDYYLRFIPGERIMIIVGPNGFGKTTTLRLIDALFNRSAGGVAEVPFQRVKVTFDDGRALTVVKREDVDRRNANSRPLTFALHSGRARETFEHRRASVDSLALPMSAIEDVIPILDQVGSREWRNLETGRVLDLEEVLAAHEDELAPYSRSGASSVPEWLQELRHSVAVRLISRRIRPKSLEIDGISRLICKDRAPPDEPKPERPSQRDPAEAPGARGKLSRRRGS